MANTGKSANTRRAAAGLLIAAGLLLGGCGGMYPTGRDGVVDMNSFEVTERDIEVARQLDAPERVMESLERGEWLYVSDRDFVRYAELAIDHMREARGQECRATWVDIPWVLRHEATAHLVVVGGEHDGAEVSVTISMSEPREYTDTWAAVTGAGEFERLVDAALSEALSDMPEGSWASAAHIKPSYTSEEHLGGDVDIYVSQSVVPTQESLDKMKTTVESALGKTGAWIEFYIAVPSTDPASGVMTVEHGVEDALDDDGGTLRWVTGEVGFDAE